MIASYSGAAGDNAAMEGFFSLLQKNVLDRHLSRNQAPVEITLEHR